MAANRISVLEEALDRVRRAVLDDGSLVGAVGSGRRKRATPRWRRVELRWVDLKAGRHLQVTAYDERKAYTSNHEPGPAAEAEVDSLLAEPFSDWHVESAAGTLVVQVTAKGDAVVRVEERVDEIAPDRGHDRPKQRLLDPGDPVFRAVGISDRDGRVKPSRQDKLRQVDEFLRALEAALASAQAAGAVPPVDADRPLRVVDLGCGNAYLTFAAYAWLTGVRGLPVEMIGVDVSEEAVARDAALAAELGWDGLTFVAGTIADTELPASPDVVLALHACDTATDEALARAVGWETPLVLAAPCCHHDLQRQLAGHAPPAPYRLVGRHGILSERFADVLTDALRAAILRRRGYRVDVAEFVESRHTPRNTMIRAVRTGAAPSGDIAEDYEALTAQWGVTPALARMLDASASADEG